VDKKRFSAPAGQLIAQAQASTGFTFTAFIPNPLPPKEEGAAVAANAAVLAEATRALGRLEAYVRLLPNADHLVRPYLRREAVLSSKIEGTRTTFTELLAFESVDSRSTGGDARDVLNYVAVLDYGLRHIRESGITRDLVLSLHRQLMQGARGESFSMPGEFRNIQNHIGVSGDIREAHYVPPPPEAMHEVLDDLFGYLENESEYLALIRTAWMHYQFEATHPFLDGNGRVGRALIPLFVARCYHLSHPLIYLSPHFERTRDEYQELLFAVSSRGAWPEWLAYFLRGVIDQASEASQIADSVLALGRQWHDQLDERRAPHNAHRLVDLVLEFIAIDPGDVRRMLNVSSQTAYSMVGHLVKAGILNEFTGRTWGKAYIARDLAAIFEHTNN
jgi:Fic family protein